MMEEYFNTLLQETERRMAQLLGRMSGVGRHGGKGNGRHLPGDGFVPESQEP